MILRPALSAAILFDTKLEFLFGLQMIVFKFTIFIMLCTLFKMKKIQILISSPTDQPEVVFEKYKNFIRNARIFLLFFWMDIMIQIGLIIWQAVLAKGGIGSPTALVVACIVYAFVYIVWFFYYLYLIIYFYQMGQVYAR